MNANRKSELAEKSTSSSKHLRRTWWREGEWPAKNSPTHVAWTRAATKRVRQSFNGGRGFLLLAAVLLATAGCTSTITMRHPDGRLAECGGTYAVGYHNFAARQGDRDCVADYQRQGYERAPR